MRGGGGGGRGTGFIHVEVSSNLMHTVIKVSFIIRFFIITNY